MDDSQDSLHIGCAQCGALNESDARYCKNCAFDLSQSSTATTHTDDAVPIEPSRKSTTKSIDKWSVVGVLVGLLVISGFTAIILRSSRSVQSETNTNSVQPAAPQLSAKAQTVEEKILRGETLELGDIQGLPNEELRILRNVHFARYGRKYNRPGLGDYFYKRQWYRPSEEYSDGLLTITDKANVNLILSVEKPSERINAENESNKSASQGTTVQSNVPRADVTLSGFPSEAEIYSLMANRGVWEPYGGTKRRPEASIVRIGNVNEQGKYLPVRINVPITNRYSEVWDCRVFRDDYNDWIMRCGR